MNWTQQEIDKLLQPRVKVIADYPNSPFIIGEILSIEKNGWYFPRGSFGIDTTKMTAIFRPLSWYEERDLKQLAKDGLKVRHNVFNKSVELSKIVNNWDFHLIDDFSEWKLKDCTPITDEEYNKNK